MTDEIDKLRREIKALKKELTLQKIGDDPRKLALLDAGVPLDRLADASAVFKPSGNRTTGIFTLDDVTGPLDSLAREWLSGRPWFGEVEAEAKPEPGGPRFEGDRVIFADGSSLPADMLGVDDLLAMAGPAPKPKAPEPKPDAYAESATNDADYLSDLDKDFRSAGPFPGKQAS
jgi:hypothetical protein